MGDSSTWDAVHNYFSCAGRQPYDKRLIAADSLMHDFPDSALALVEGVCRDSLTAESERAYRDLLFTQARYRCYITRACHMSIRPVKNK